MRCFKLILCTLFFQSSLASAALTNPPTSLEKQYLAFKNELSNPGFESGKAGWTVTTTAFTITTTTGEVAEGVQAAEWNPAGAESLKSTSWAVKSNAGGNAVGFCKVRTNADADYDLEIYDVTNAAVVAEIDLPASTSLANYSVNFVAASATSYRIQVTSAGNDDEIQVDACGIGYAEGYNLANVTQSNLVGMAYYPATANCGGWTRSNTAYGAFASDSDCPAPTVVSNIGPGVISTTDADLPQFTVNSLPSGTYLVKIRAGGAGGASAYQNIAINDGTTTSPGAGFNANTTTNESVEVTGVFVYTATGNRTFALFGKAASSSVTLDGIGFDTVFEIYRYPTASQLVSQNNLNAQSWSGYHDNTCAWTRTNAAYGDFAADASCALVERTNRNFGTVSTSGSVLPAITFTPSRAQRYFVCAGFLENVGANSAEAAVRIWDGTTVIQEDSAYQVTSGSPKTHKLCGIYVATSTSAVTLTIQGKSASGTMTFSAGAPAGALEWSIFALDQPFPAQALVNTVRTKDDTKTWYDLSAQANSSGTISSESGDWINGSASKSTSGTQTTYTYTLVTGVFSAAPNCIAGLVGDATTTAQFVCNIFSTSTTTIKVYCSQQDGGTEATYDSAHTIFCKGPQ